MPFGFAFTFARFAGFAPFFAPRAPAAASFAFPFAMRPSSLVTSATIS
jgi:hypothetical protein